MKHFMIVANPLKDENGKNADVIFNYLIEKGCTCCVHVTTDFEYQNGTFHAEDIIPKDTECILVLGGDGTFIETARNTGGLDMPLLGINLGTLGFLAEVEISAVKEALDRLIRDDYQLEERMMLNGEVIRDGQVIARSNALNDVVITRSGTMQIVNFSIYVNDRFLNGYSADGVILATPTGSTGYSLSAGGPIVEPSARLIMITPISPHDLNNRSMILSPEDKIVIGIQDGRNGKKQKVEVNFDGGHQMELRTGDRIRVSGSDKITKIIKLNQSSFIEVLHNKMVRNS